LPATPTKIELFQKQQRSLCLVFSVQLVFGSAMSGACSYARKPDIKYISEDQVKVLLDAACCSSLGFGRGFSTTSAWLLVCLLHAVIEEHQVPL
jgi:hypothetical protein